MVSKSECQLFKSQVVANSYHWTASRAQKFTGCAVSVNFPNEDILATNLVLSGH